MKALARFAELERNGQEGLPRLEQCIGKLKPELKPCVLEYLARGTTIFDVMEATPDPLNSDAFIPGGSSLVTDGLWVWRLDLPSYVKAYNVGLPDEFIQTAVEAVSNKALPFSKSLRVFK